MRMKALRSFRGDEGTVRAGHEFDAKAGNVGDYERLGLAVVVKAQVKAEKAPVDNKMESPPANKAAELGAAGGPLSLPGGEIGEAAPPSLSGPGLLPLVPPDRVTPPRTRRRRKS